MLPFYPEEAFYQVIAGVGYLPVEVKVAGLFHEKRT